jgi:hypothetical protein
LLPQSEVFQKEVAARLYTATEGHEKYPQQVWHKWVISWKTQQDQADQVLAAQIPEPR